MERNIAKAKNILLTCFSIAYSADVIFVSLDSDWVGGVRLILTLILMFFVYEGRSWAKWVIIILSLASGLFGTIGSKFIFDGGSVEVAILLLMHSLFWLGTGLFILRNKNLAKFFRLQKEKRIKSRESI